MYSKDEAITLQNLTQSFLKGNEDILSSKDKTEDLRKILRFHEYRYYILNDPLIADGEYDQLFKLLERTENGIRIGLRRLTPTLQGKRHSRAPGAYAFLIILITKPILRFWPEARRLSNWITYSVEPKFDGGSIS